ncbi:MAG TPA: glutathione binding-like protein [Polyangiaceae bacterium]|jgi:glutathione S-transferase
MMKLYFSPLACSLATRIALYEAGAQASFVQVDGRTKLTRDGRDFRTVTRLGLVPTLETDAGDVLSENAAVLQYVARSYPAARLAPEDALGTSRLQQWLCFIGTELHKTVYVPLLDPNAHEEVKAYALRKVDLRFDWLQQQLEGRKFLLDAFSIADAYLFAVLNWSTVVPVQLERWPAVRAYHQGLRERPSVARAFAEELELYREELAARAAQ